jgi:hypothetical protein
MANGLAAPFRWSRKRIISEVTSTEKPATKVFGGQPGRMVNRRSGSQSSHKRIQNPSPGAVGPASRIALRSTSGLRRLPAKQPVDRFKQLHNLHASPGPEGGYPDGERF